MLKPHLFVRFSFSKTFFLYTSKPTVYGTITQNKKSPPLLYAANSFIAIGIALAVDFPIHLCRPATERHVRLGEGFEPRSKAGCHAAWGQAVWPGSFISLLFVNVHPLIQQILSEHECNLGPKEWKVTIDKKQNIPPPPIDNWNFPTNQIKFQASVRLQLDSFSKGSAGRLPPSVGMGGRGTSRKYKEIYKYLRLLFWRSDSMLIDRYKGTIQNKS